MRLYLICDNEDTALGMRLAGIEGAVTESKDEVRELFEKTAQDSDIGIILINQTLVSLCSDEISAFRKTHSDGTSNSIADYVSEAIGIKI